MEIEAAHPIEREQACASSSEHGELVAGISSGAEPPLGFRNGGEQCALIEGLVQGRSRAVGEQEQRRSLQMRVGDAVYGAGGTWADTDQHHAGLAGQRAGHSSYYRRVRLRSGEHELDTDCAGLIDPIEARPTSRDPDHPSHTVTRQCGGDGFGQSVGGSDNEASGVGSRGCSDCGRMTVEIVR